MILVRNESVCRITREQLLEGAKESLSKTLSQMYQAEFLEEVLDEATTKVEIPAIVDSNSIFLLKNNELFEYRFTDSEEYLLLENQYQLSSLSPRYADSESGIKLQFDMSTFLMRNCRCEKKVLILKTDNKILFASSLENLSSYWYTFDKVSVDLHNDERKIENIMTDFERQYYKEHRQIYYVDASFKD